MAASAAELDALLAESTVKLLHDNTLKDEGRGSNVLDSPLRALRHFLAEMRECPGAAELLPGEVVTTGTWTDAYAVQPGEHWQAQFSGPLGQHGPLKVDFR